MTVEVDVIVEDQRWDALDLAHTAQGATEQTIDCLSIEVPIEVALLATNDARIAELNAEFRAKPTPTNVLSWPSQPREAEGFGGRPAPPDPDPTGEPVFLGDVALAFETCLAEATAAQKPHKDHVTHLIVHGILHLLGYDHVDDADADLMETTETAILAKLGITAPYD